MKTVNATEYSFWYYATMIVTLNMAVCTLAAQDIIKERTQDRKEGFVSPGSTVYNHVTANGIGYDLSEFTGGLPYGNKAHNYYVVAQQSDLIYFEEYSDSTQTRLMGQGYYRLVYVGTEVGYVWQKDLVYNVYGLDGQLDSKAFYDKGRLIRILE
jgi:hypothetical protein